MLKKQLKVEFEMKDLGPVKKILGIELVRNRKEDTLFLTQYKYIYKVLEKLGMVKAKPIQTPLAAHCRLLYEQCPMNENEKSEMSKIPFFKCCRVFNVCHGADKT